MICNMCYWLRVTLLFSFLPFVIATFETKKRSLRSSSNTCADMGVILGEDASQSKVCDFGVEIFVEEDVACFDVSVHNTCVTSPMQIC